MIDNLQISKGDIGNAIRIIRETAEWCEATGKNMWKPEELTEETLSIGLTAENFYTARINGENAAAMILQWRDPVFWPENPAGTSGYIHKLCVLRKFGGQGLSRQIITFAADECRKRGVGYLRLDTGFQREPLRRLYESIGFVNVGKRIVRMREYALYEMKII